jgi:tetratricopeptide (TPR) repeat protein
MGNGSRAIEEINKAMALSPYDPLMYAYSGIAAMAYLADGQYERAIECALRSLRENRTYTSAYRQLTFALVLAGREDEARAAARRLLELEPGLTVAGFRRRQRQPQGRPLLRCPREGWYPSFRSERSRGSGRIASTSARARPQLHRFLLCI